jgi:hypothetical protein
MKQRRRSILVVSVVLALLVLIGLLIRWQKYRPHAHSPSPEMLQTIHRRVSRA